MALNEALRDIEMNISEFEMLYNNHLLKDEEDCRLSFQTVNYTIKERITAVFDTKDKVIALVEEIEKQDDKH